MIGGTKSSWRPVTRVVLQESIVGLILFNISINDLDDGEKHTLSRLADDTKLGGAADMSKAHAAIQRDLGWRNVLTGTS